MDVFLARQPILDRHNKLFGYKLLFRDSQENIYPDNDVDKATIVVIRNSFVNIGIEKVTGGKKAFINFTENILQSDIFDVLPPQSVVVEILENIEPHEKVLEICRKLKVLGYAIALDDFVYSDKYRDLIGVADIIKIDFKVTKGDQRKKVMQQVNRENVKFLAEKVEIMDDFNEAVSLGYTYFQGHYFSKPTMMLGKKMSENKLVYMKLLHEISSNNFNVNSIENLIKKDVSLSLKLLKLINSANYSFLSEIRSMKQALALLGEKEIKNWLYLMVFMIIGEDKPEILIVNTLIRARFAELIASKMHKKINTFNAYLVGMLSMIDLLLDRHFEEILQELLIPNEVKDALNKKSENNYSKLLLLIIAYENGKWDEVSEISKELDLDENCLPNLYYESIYFAKI